MKQLTELAEQAIRKNMRVMGKLMIEFNRGQWSIENWIKDGDIRLLSPAAIKIISEESGLDEDRLTEPKKELA